MSMFGKTDKELILEMINTLDDSMNELAIINQELFRRIFERLNKLDGGEKPVSDPSNTVGDNQNTERKG